MSNSTRNNSSSSDTPQLAAEKFILRVAASHSFSFRVLSMQTIIGKSSKYSN